MSNYKLTYFGIKGIAEPIRYIFAYAGIKFEDNRVNKDRDWGTLKAEQPFGQLPVLDTGDAFLLTQSVAISRYLGRTFNLMGRDSVHNAQLDALVDHMQDIHMKLYNAIISNEETAASNIAIFETDVLSMYLQKFNAIAAQGAFYGNDITWADVYFAAFIDCTESRMKKSVLDSYPFLSALKKRVESAQGVQEYLEKRPFSVL